MRATGSSQNFDLRLVLDLTGLSGLSGMSGPGDLCSG